MPPIGECSVTTSRVRPDCTIASSSASLTPHSASLRRASAASSGVGAESSSCCAITIAGEYRSTRWSPAATAVPVKSAHTRSTRARVRAVRLAISGSASAMRPTVRQLVLEHSPLDQCNLDRRDPPRRLRERDEARVARTGPSARRSGRHEVHAAQRAGPGMILADLRVHAAGPHLGGLGGSGSGCGTGGGAALLLARAAAGRGQQRAEHQQAGQAGGQNGPRLDPRPHGRTSIAVTGGGGTDSSRPASSSSSARRTRRAARASASATRASSAARRPSIKASSPDAPLA